MSRMLTALVLYLVSGLAYANWEGDRTIDPMTDDVEGVTYIWSTDKVAALGFRCGRRFSHDGLEVFIGFIGWTSDENEIRYRIGEGPIEKISMGRFLDFSAISTDTSRNKKSGLPAYPIASGLRLYNKDKHNFIARIRTAERLVVELISREKLDPWIFETAGIEGALKKYCPKIY